eukprot:jgi/Mesen1/10829/ME000093S10347
MELEIRQVELLEQFCLLAKSTRGRGLAELISQATSEPNLFAFGELLDVPQIQELKTTEHAGWYELLQLYAYGTWADYKAKSPTLPSLQPPQVLKLKQLTVMTLSETTKVLSYELLMQQLDISHVRELEDLLINDCMYSGIVRGKLDQRRRCFEVHFAAGRDLRPGQLDGMIGTLAGWLSTSEDLLQSIQDKIRWADDKSDQHRRHKKELDDKMEEARKAIKLELDLRGQSDVMYSEGAASTLDYMEDGAPSRPKRRR